MVNKTDIEHFLSLNKLAIAGVSRNKNKFGRIVYNELKAKGFEVFPINPTTDHIDAEQCFSELQSLPIAVDGVVIVVDLGHTEKIIRDAIKMEIKNIWIHQRVESPSVIQLCQENDVNLIQGECILMFAEPVGWFHRLHRGLRKVFGKLPD